MVNKAVASIKADPTALLRATYRTAEISASGIAMIT